MCIYTYICIYINIYMYIYTYNTKKVFPSTRKYQQHSDTQLRRIRSVSRFGDNISLLLRGVMLDEEKNSILR